MRPHGLNMLLVLHPKPLLLIHHHQAQLFPLHPGLQQPVRADHNIHRPVPQPGQDLLRIRRRREPRQSPNRHRETRHPLRKRC